MQVFRRTMANWLCCFGIQSQDDLKYSSSLRRVQVHKDSPISMSVPGTSVPHALDSPDALQKIFASNSSMRGYHAVQAASPKRPVAHGSLDLTFRFGSKSPHKKPRGRLEQLTQHVKQKLSEDRLSWNEEQTRTSAAAPSQLTVSRHGSRVDTDNYPLDASQKSLGLTELLASRAPSEGGYDSDAKSMRTPTILGAADALHIGPKNIRRSLAAITGSQVDEPPVQLDQNSNSSVMNSSATARIPEPSLPSPELVEVPILEAPKDDHDQRSDDPSRLLSNGTVDGTIEIPTTPELKALRMPSISSAESEWQLALPEPPQVSSSGNSDLHTNREQTEVSASDTLRRRAHRVRVDKQETAVTPGLSDLISELDPALVEFMNSFVTLPDLGEAADTSPPLTAIKTGAMRSSSEDSTPKPSAITEEYEPNKAAISEEARKVSLDSQSLHLFNMRISQKLASNSQIAKLSPTSPPNSTSTKSLTTVGPTTRSQQGQKFSAGRAPTFIAVEHIRRPSDPETKRLFEPSKPSGPHPSHNRALSCGSNLNRDCAGRKKSEDVLDDSSSYYGSVIDGKMDDNEASLSMVRKASLKNPNSLAIGGRSASGPAYGAHRAVSDKQKADDSLAGQSNPFPYRKPQRLEHSSKTSHEALRTRSFAMPKQSKFIKIDTTPTPISRRLHSSTEGNERMSEIEFEKDDDYRRKFGHSTNTQTSEDQRNENFSDVDLTVPNFTTAVRANQNQTEDGWLSNGRRTGWGFHFTDKTPAKYSDETRYKLNEETGNSVLRKESANASVIWHKAFQRLGEPHDLGKLLATPQFDREGRRKLSVKSASDQGQPVRTVSPLPIAHRRSRSVDTEHRGSFRDQAAKGKRRRSLPVLSQLGYRSMHRKPQTSTKREKLKKRSLGDLGRRVVATETPTATIKSVASKDPFSIWGRFASHSRDQRNGPAGSSDEVKVRDFNHDSDDSYQDTSADKEMFPALDLASHVSWNIFGLAKRRSTKNMFLSTSSAERIKQRRKAFRGRFKKLYRTKSSELHAYAVTQGHRSSVSTAQTAQYPELECLPGEGLFRRSSPLTPASESRVDGTSERNRVASLDTISEVTSKRSRSMHSYTVPWSKRDAEEWSKLYRDCVSSMSALRSDDGIEQDTSNNPPVEAKRVFSLTSVLRDSTVNFEAELRRDADGAKDKLLQQLQSSDESEKVLHMPGSFV